MSELELIATIAEYGIGAMALILSVIALWIVRDILRWQRTRQETEDKRDETREQRESTERQVWMDLLERVLDKQTDKFAELTNVFKKSLSNTVDMMQVNLTAILDQMIEQMTKQMDEVTASRQQKLDLMHNDVKVVPAEVQRVLQNDIQAIHNAIDTANVHHQEVIREAVTQALTPLLGQIEEKLDQMPGAEISRQIIRGEIKTLQQQVVEQVTEQISPLLDKLSDIAVALDKLQLPHELSTEGGEEPSDKTEENKEHVELVT